MSESTLRNLSDENEVSFITESSSLELTKLLPAQTSKQLIRMFRDPYVLEREERVELIQQLKAAAARDPTVPEIRIVLGMALCVNFEAQEGMEELREASQMAPDNFLARLKFGELLMRLRICKQAEEETRAAAKLARNAVQSELAHKQATIIRNMLREGVERGNQGKIVSAFDWIFSLFTRLDKNAMPATLPPR